MLDRVQRKAAEGALTGTLDVAILSLATAVPPNVLGQAEIAARAHAVFPQFARLDGLFGNTGIETRYACEVEDWYISPKGWEERTTSFQSHALDLLEEAAIRAISDAGLATADIDALVVNTTTGLAVPSLDALLINRMGFRPDVERLPVFGFGCGGGIGGLARAARLAQAAPGSNVLFLTVELCSLCLRVNDPGIEMFIATALFGDGAAGAVLNACPGEGAANAPRTRILATGEHFWPGTEHIMGWDVLGDGFGVVLSPDLPDLVRERFGEALDAFLARRGIAREDFAGFLIHPGGRKVIETVAEVLGLSRHQLRHSWNTLRDFGNMSSATVLFVLAEALRAGDRGRHLLTAFGPGFSAYFMVMEL